MPGTEGGTVPAAGALGVVGRAALDVYAQDPAWRVIGLSRRCPETTVAADCRGDGGQGAGLG